MNKAFAIREIQGGGYTSFNAIAGQPVIKQFPKNRSDLVPAQ
jgi:hypothetical protein